MLLLLAFSFLISFSDNLTITSLSAIQNVASDETNLIIEYR